MENVLCEFYALKLDALAGCLSGELTSLSFVVLDDAPLDEQQGILKYRDRRGTCPAPTHTFVSKPIWQTPCSNMQRRLQVLDNFYLDNEIIFESPFRVGAPMFTPWRRVSSLLVQPLFRFRLFLKPGASAVWIIGHCVSSLDVSKLIGITLFDGETVSHSFLDRMKRLCCQISVYTMQKPS